jgi:Ribbon-helix-helix protein, copG family
MNAPVALRPLPTRITPAAFARLQHARAESGLSVQEMVRRAIDEYLDRMELGQRSSPAVIRGDIELPPLPPGKRKHPLPKNLAEAPDAPQKAHQRGKSKVTFR